MRAFLAIPVPDRLRTRLADSARNFPDLIPVAEQNLHLTLRFLGDIRDSRPIAAAVEKVCSAHARLPITLGRLGCFPNPRKARVIWTGLVAGEMNAAALVSGIDTALTPLNIAADYRPWRGHVTLGRFSHERRVDKRLLDPDVEFGTFQAENVVLFASERGENGAVHRAIHVLPIG